MPNYAMISHIELLILP